MDAQTKRPVELVAEQKKKKSYCSPQLTEYGSVRELTSGAPGSGSDAGGSTYVF